MHLKIFLVYALIVQVKSECSGYFECLSGLVAQNFFGGNNTNESDVFKNDTEVIEVTELNNNTVSAFGLSGIGKSFTGALTDVSTLIQDQVKGLYKILGQTDVHKDINNKTEIHVRAFSFGNINGTVWNNTETTFNIPDVVINNFTQFNDELNALKVEVEKQLQDEIDSFIAQVLDNDTVDWIDVTENSLTDVDFSTTERPHPDFMNDFETQIVNSDNNNVKNLENSFYDLNGAGFKVPLNSWKSEENSTNYQSTEGDVTDVKILENIFYDANNSGFKVSLISRLAEEDSTNDQSIEADTPTSPELTSDVENTESISTTIEPSAFISEEFVENTNTSLPAVTVSQTTITKSTPSTTAEDAKVDNIANTATVITAEKATEENDHSITIPTKLAADQNKEVEKQGTQTKAQVDYNLIENVKNNEISKDDPTDYDVQDDKDDNATDYPIIDYIDLYKDTTNEDIDYVPTTPPDGVTDNPENMLQNENEFTNADNGYYTNDTSSPASIFPWISAIFIKDTDSYQFDYYCDGILLSNTVILTAGRCLQRGKQIVGADDVIVFLGKRSLQSTGEGESILKVKHLTFHPNYTLQENTAQNDLAVLLLAEPAVFSEGIQPACLLDGGDVEEAVTTAWGERLSGIRFVEKNQTCEKEPVENTFCATYGSTVALCPSFGGVYAAKQSDHWCAGGIRSADPSNRGPCFDKTVAYIDLSSYSTWIDTMIK